jgi:hypothetical protein
MINITGNPDGVVTLKGLTDGPYAGMVIWQNRTSDVAINIEGNGSFTLDGTFYTAGALLKVTGNGTAYYTDPNGNVVSGTSQIGSNYVSKDLAIAGNGNVTVNYPGTKARTRILTLVE